MSPTVLQAGPYRFFFFSSDRGEPRHVHVGREDRLAKFWLEPVQLEYNHGFSSTEIARIRRLVQQHTDELVRAWDGFFRSGR
ncbi:MAG: DUF4160 domain-containing protein [Candidatus Rokubacteria bacterium]|nr:DUF4160 domain-containing protein [Candidatus Rokubacteria bacterium]